MRAKEIIDDIVRVARDLGLVPGMQGLSRSEYLSNGGRFSLYEIYDGGMTWSDYCVKAGFKPKTKEFVPDEVYFERLKRAVHELGRFPKLSERKKFGLNFSKGRWSTLVEFIKTASSLGIVKLPYSKKVKEEKSPTHRPKESPRNEYGNIHSDFSRPIPPIPEKTKRKKWERTRMIGFPYAPQDESGVIALFAILCAQGTIPWQIIELKKSKGIDAICYDDKEQREFRVELKHTLSRSNWNHTFDSFDYLVCLENRWRDFPKPVLELRYLINE
ncbi:MAG: hypothetical protein L0Y68_01005 [Candidatus Dadabacteria bacterium]|nr:hypothetical protein [Candidatus Dadabacteria bacterium]